MIKCEGMTSYLMRLSQVKDELATIGLFTLDGDMERIALKGFTEDWKPFIKGIVAREKLSDWDRLWHDLIPEESRDEDLRPKKRASNDDVALSR